MKERKPLTDEAGEVRELLATDFAQFRPEREALSVALAAKLAKLGRHPQKSLTKERITIPLSHDVVERFRATGDGWQTRIDAALRDWLDTHFPV